MVGIIAIGAALGAATLAILAGRRREPVPLRVEGGRAGERRHRQRPR